MVATTSGSGDGPLTSGFTVTPNDVTTFLPTRQIRITGTSGNINVVWMDGSTSIEPVLTNTSYNWRLTKVLSSSTTATGIRGYY